MTLDDALAECGLVAILREPSAARLLAATVLVGASVAGPMLVEPRQPAGVSQRML